jgi:O-antigen ligase
MTEIELNNATAAGVSGAAQAVRSRERVGKIARLIERVSYGALLSLIVLVAIPYGTVEPWWVAVFECAVFALGAVWLVAGLVRGTWRVRGVSMLAPLGALILFAYVQSLPLSSGSTAGDGGVGGDAWRALSADPFETRLWAWKMLAIVLAGNLLLSYTSNRRRLRALIYTIIGLGAASALFGIIRQATQETPGFVLPLLGYDGREYGQFISRNHFAFLMEMALGLVLGLIVGRGVRRERVLIYAAVGVPIWTALVLSNSRGGILSMFLQLLFVALMYPKVSAAENARAVEGGRQGLMSRVGGGGLAARVLVVACLALGVAVSIVWVGGEPLVSRLETVSGEVRAVGEEWREGTRRAQIWRATGELIKAHPVFGVGFGGYWAAIPEYHDASGEATPQQAHNDYLELLASGGLVGAALAAWFVVAFLRLARRRLRSADRFRRAACFGALAGLVGVAAHSFVDFGLHITVNALVAAALVVIATADVRAEEKTPPEGGGRVRRRTHTRPVALPSVRRAESENLA